MKKGQIAEGYIKRVDFPNKAFLEIDGEERKVLIKEGIAGQKVQVLLTKVRKEKCEGRL